MYLSGYNTKVIVGRDNKYEYLIMKLQLLSDC